MSNMNIYQLIRSCEQSGKIERIISTHLNYTTAIEAYTKEMLEIERFKMTEPDHYDHMAELNLNTISIIVTPVADAIECDDTSLLT